jgi:hypothetical protein
MYSDIEIETLSKNQVSKLLNGHPVRLMVGVGHTIGVSSEQYKKLMKAKNKGSSATITLDPYQIDESQHLRDDVRGSGVKSIIPNLKKVVRRTKGSGVNQISLKQLAKMNNEILNQNVDEGNDVNVVSFEDDIEGEGIKDFVGMLKKKKVGRKFVNTVKKVAKNPLVKKVGEALVERAIKTIAGGEVKKTVITGKAQQGLKKPEKPITGKAQQGLKKPKKVVKKKPERGGALFPAGGALYAAGEMYKK